MIVSWCQCPTYKDILKAYTTSSRSRAVTHPFRISPRLKPVRNVVPSFGWQASAEPTLARANLPLIRMMRSMISALGISTRLRPPVSLDLAAQERLRVSGAHSPRARWAGRGSSRPCAKPLIFSRTVARRQQRPQGVPFFDLGGYPSFDSSSTTIDGGNLVLLVLCCAFGLVWRSGQSFILFHSLAPISHVPPFLSIASVRLIFLYPRFLSLASVAYRMWWVYFSVTVFTYDDL